MKLQARRMAVCSMMTALGVVVLLLGAVLSLGMYACPMIVGLCLMPIGQEFGKKYQILLWLAISFLSMLLVPNPEENLMFFGLFGWYPILWPSLQRLSKGLGMAVKLLLFNAVIIALEALVLLVLAPEAMEPSMLFLLLVLGNVTFVLYDRVIPKFGPVAHKYLRKYLK